MVLYTTLKKGDFDMKKSSILSMPEAWTDESNAVIKLDELLEYVKDRPINEQNEILIELSKISLKNNQLTEKAILELKNFFDKRNSSCIEKRKVIDTKKVSLPYKKYVNKTIIDYFENINSLIFLDYNDFIVEIKSIEYDKNYLMLGIIREITYYNRLADEAFEAKDLDLILEINEIVLDLQSKLDYLKNNPIDKKEEDKYNILFLETSSGRNYFLEDLKGLEEYYDSFKKLFTYLEYGRPYDVKYFPSDNKKLVGLAESRDVRGKTRLFFKKLDDRTYIVLGAMVKKVDKTGGYHNQIETRYRYYLNNESFILDNLYNEEVIEAQKRHYDEVVSKFSYTDKTLGKRG